MNIIPLFPQPVGVYNFPREFTEEELNFLMSLEKKENMSCSRSKNSYILENEKLSFIKEYIYDCTKCFLYQVYSPSNKNLDIKITQSWVMYANLGETTHRHIHGNSVFSGVLYINADPEVDRIRFHNTSFESKHLFHFESSEFNTFNSEECNVPINTGMLIIFNSELCHSIPTVRTNKEYKTRVSIAYNAFLKGRVGSPEGLTELIIE